MKRILAISLTMTMVVVGCMPGVYVKKNPGEHNRGVRYYRPKPYLLISPATVVTETTTTKADSVSKSVNRAIADNQGQMYSLQLDYLPDFSEEYAISVRTGVGKAKVELDLEDGWNLTGINQDLDSQFDENVTAAAELVKAATPLLRGGDAALQAEPQTKPREVIVYGNNVPVGYYEAVLGEMHHGKKVRKELLGFRYVGFVPFGGAPLVAGGTTPLYGLVFDSGVMTFKPLDEVAYNPLHVGIANPHEGEDRFSPNLIRPEDKPDTDGSETTETDPLNCTFREDVYVMPPG